MTIDMALRLQGLNEPLKLPAVRDELIEVLRFASRWSAREGVDVRITSLADHKHGKTSLHPEGLAVDMQVQFANGQVDKRSLRKLTTFLRAKLGLPYDCIFEATDGSHQRHLHVEYDARERPRRKDTLV